MYQKEYMVINAKSIDTLRAQACTGEYQNQSKLANSPATHDYRTWFTQSLLYRSTLFQNSDSLEKLYKLSMDELFSEEFKNLVIYDLKRDISGLYTSIDSVRNLGPIGTYDLFSSMVGSISAKYIPTFAPMNYDFTTDSSLHFNVSSEEKRNLILNRKGPVGGGDPKYMTKYIYTPLTIGELEAGPQPGAEYSSKRTEITEEYVPLSMSIIQKLVKYAETYSENADDSYVEPIFPGASEIYVREYTATKFRYLPLSSKEIAKGPITGTTYYTKPVNTTANYVVAPYSDAYTCYIREYDNVVYTYSPLSCIDAAMGPKKNTQYFTRLSKVVDTYVEAQLTTAPSDTDELYYKEFDQIAYNRVPLTPEEVTAGPVAGVVYSHEETIPPTTEYVKATSYEDGKEFYEYDPVSNSYNISTNFETVDDHVLVDQAKSEYNPDKEYFLKQGDQYVKARTTAESTQTRYAALTPEEIVAGPQPGERYVFPEFLHVGEVQDEERAAGPNPAFDYYELSAEGVPTFVGKLVAFEPDKVYTWFELGTEYQDVTDILNTFGSFALDYTKIMKEVVINTIDPNIVDFYVEPQYALNRDPYNVDTPYYVNENNTMRVVEDTDLVDKTVYNTVDKTTVTTPEGGTTYYKLVDGNYVPCEVTDFAEVPKYEGVPPVITANASRDPDTTYYKLVDGDYVPCTDDDFVKETMYSYNAVDKGVVTTPDPDTEYYVITDGNQVLSTENDFSTGPTDNYTKVDTDVVTTPDPDGEYYVVTDGNHVLATEDNFETATKDNYTPVDKDTVTTPDPDGEYYVFETDQYRPTTEGDFETATKDNYTKVDTDVVTTPDPDGEYYVVADGNHVLANEGNFETATKDNYTPVDKDTVTTPDPDGEYYVLDVDQHRLATEGDFNTAPKDNYTKVETDVVTTPAPDTEYYVFEMDQYRLAIESDYDTTPKDNYTKVDTDVVTTPDPDGEYYVVADGNHVLANEGNFETATKDNYTPVDKDTVTTPDPDGEYYVLDVDQHRLATEGDFSITTNDSYTPVDQDAVTTPEDGVEYFTTTDNVDYVSAGIGGADGLAAWAPDTEYFTKTTTSTKEWDGGTEYYTKSTTTEKIWASGTEYFTKSTTDEKVWRGGTEYFTKSTTDEKVWNPDTEYFTKSTTTEKVWATDTEYFTKSTTNAKVWKGDTEYFTKSTTTEKIWASGTEYFTKSSTTEKTWSPDKEYFTRTEAGIEEKFSRDIQYFTIIGTESGWKDDLDYYTPVTVKDFKPDTDYYVYDGYKLVFKEDVEYYTFELGIVRFKAGVEYFEAIIVDNGVQIVDKDALTAFDPAVTYYKKVIDYVNSTRTENYVRLEASKYDPLETYYTKSVETVESDEYEEFFGSVAFNPDVTYYTRVADLSNSTLSDRYTPYTGEYDPNQTYYKLEITETDSVYDVVSDAERAAGPVPGTVYYVKRVEVSESFEEVPPNEIAIHIAAGQTAAVTESQPIEYFTKVGNVYEAVSGTFDVLTTYYTREVTVKELDVYDRVENIVAFEPNVTYYYEVSINSDGYVEKTNLTQFVNNKVYYIKTVDPNNSAMGENYVPYHGTTFNDYPEFYTKSVHVEEFDEYVGYVGLKEFNPHVIYFHRALNVDKTVLAPEEINIIKKQHTIAKLNAYHDVYIRDALTTIKEIMSKHSLHVIISSVNMEADKFDRTIANEMYIKFLNVFAYLAVVIGHSKNLDDTCKGYKFINDMINVGIKHTKTIADMFSTANYVSKIVLEHLLPQSIKEAVFQHYDICSPVCDNISCSPNLTQSYVTENMVENMIKLRNLLDNVNISTETDDNALMGLFIMAYNIFVQLFFYSAFNSRNKVQIVKAVSTLFKTFTPSFDQVITAEELKSFIELGDDK